MKNPFAVALALRVIGVVLLALAIGALAGDWWWAMLVIGAAVVLESVATEREASRETS